MTDKIKQKLEFLKKGDYKKLRRPLNQKTICWDEGANEMDMQTYLLKHMLKNEEPLLYDDDIFGFNRSVYETPVGYIKDKCYALATGNITPNYEYALNVGMDSILERIQSKLSNCSDEKTQKFYLSMSESISDCLELADRYRDFALEKGNKVLYEALCQVPHKPAKTFHQACIFVKFIQFTIRCNRNIHITFGGFDKYMLKYFMADLERGMSHDELFEILEDFFININIDSDIYYGAQQGDNGMSMVLGGRDFEGNDRYSILSQLCLKAAMELELIDPKINLRVDKNTPLERYEFATMLTKRGLGFPQYCNDDVVIPGLIKMGYDPKDAHEYTVAACWEFIIPGKGFDIPNVHRVNFPKALELATNECLLSCETFDEFLVKVKEYVEAECESIAEEMLQNREKATPYLSVFVDDCIERGLDVSQGGGIYNNYGAHGVGISTAADIIAAIKKAVYEEKYCTKEELVCAIKNNFNDNTALRNYLLSCPKMGNNDDYVDDYAGFIIDIFSDVFSRYKNHLNGIFRPGTGSAMEYVRCAGLVGATADGRRMGDAFGSSYSPSTITKLNGPLSCIQSFSKHDLTKVINGGPLTMEIHNNTFRNDDGIKKVASLVKTFISLGGHQLQLNAINREVLLDAQKHPELHKNLIVRVWGWSGYFNELSIEYQNHIIKRTEFMI
ncbi:MAG: pyruvate formate-lyase [Clostridia bacterium]|nr:pyruvate formate-lyase [Clostridia bacterium]